MPTPHLIIVAHGSRSALWVSTVREWFVGVEHRLPGHMTAELTFLEIATPLFADRLRELAASPPPTPDPQPLHLFPFFLTRSGHAGDEIPGIAADILRDIPFRIITPSAWEEVLGANTEHRLRQLGADAETQVIISGYGASSHNDEWTSLLENVQRESGEYALGPKWLWAPCGHFLEDYKAPLNDALAEIEKSGRRHCAILPLFISVSSYQEQLIPQAIKEHPALNVLFVPDAILPDPKIEEWAAGLLGSAAKDV